jgi:hypothetical protein
VLFDDVRVHVRPLAHGRLGDVVGEVVGDHPAPEWMTLRLDGHFEAWSVADTCVRESDTVF